MYFLILLCHACLHTCNFGLSIPLSGSSGRTISIVASDINPSAVNERKRGVTYVHQLHATSVLLNFPHISVWQHFYPSLFAATIQFLTRIVSREVILVDFSSSTFHIHHYRSMYETAKICTTNIIHTPYIFRILADATDPSIVYE